MIEYEVTWGINIDADSPREAAEKALEILRSTDPANLGLAFEVAAAPDVDAVTIDLSPGAGTEDVDLSTDVAGRLEYLRGEIEAERISYGEIAELTGLAEQIDPGDVQLLEWAGVPEDLDERAAWFAERRDLENEAFEQARRAEMEPTPEEQAVMDSNADDPDFDVFSARAAIASQALENEDNLPRYEEATVTVDGYSDLVTPEQAATALIEWIRSDTEVIHVSVKREDGEWVDVALDPRPLGAPGAADTEALNRIERERPCLDADTTDADLAEWARNTIIPTLASTGRL